MTTQAERASAALGHNKVAPFIISDTFTRPGDTTQYASGDLVADSTTASSVTAMTFGSGPALIRGARLTKSDDDVTAATFRLHLFSADPVSSAPANGDNGAISLNAAISSYLGSIDLDMTASPDIFNTAGNQARGVPIQGSEIVVEASVGTIYGLLEARGTYTPANAEVFTVYLSVLRG